MSSLAVSQSIKKFYFPSLAIARFTTNRISKMAIIWGFVFGISSLSSMAGFAKLYKTPHAREQLVNAFGHNAGLNALFGIPNKLDTAGGFTAWRMLGLAMLIASIWGLLTATGAMRGEEENGRWEMFLTGLTTSRKATANALIGLTLSLVPVALITAALTYVASQSSHLGYSVLSALFYGLAISASAAIFISVGALTSQIGAIRRQAAMYGAIIFGASLLLRAAGDVSSNFQWLSSVSPLGWVEKLHPLTGSDPWWLIPIAAFCIVFGAAALYLAGRRDLGASLISDKDTARPRKKLLKNSIGLTFRLERNALIGWTIGVGFVGLLYGYIAKTAISLFKGSGAASKVIGKIAGESQIQGVETFLGIVFLLLMIVVMNEVTNLVIATRREEAQGYLDNLLVRSATRFRWLLGRHLVTISAAALAVLAGSFLAWVAVTSQHVNVPLSTMLQAGVNIMPAILFVFGLGILTYGFMPRLTNIVLYSSVAGSFLIETIGSAINLNHYILDISIIHHVALAPAKQPNWHSDIIILIISLFMITLGTYRFNSRDLQGE